MWDLFNVDNVYTTWNNILRSVYGLPRQTHRYLLEPFTELSHLYTKLTNRFLKFYKSLFYSSKSVIRNLRLCQESDCRSNFGRNIKGICQYNETTDIFKCKTDLIKYKLIPENEKWRVSVLKELVNARTDFLSLTGFSNKDIEDMICYVCCS